MSHQQVPLTHQLSTISKVRCFQTWPAAVHRLWMCLPRLLDLPRCWCEGGGLLTQHVDANDDVSPTSEKRTTHSPKSEHCIGQKHKVLHRPYAMPSQECDLQYMCMYAFADAEGGKFFLTSVQKCLDAMRTPKSKSWLTKCITD